MQIDVDLEELNAAVRARATKEAALEARACAFIRQYGFFLPGPAKELFRELADHFNWQKLKGVL